MVSVTSDVLIWAGIEANSVGPDQTAPQEQSDQGLHCLLKYFCAIILAVLVWLCKAFIFLVICECVLSIKF